VWTKPKAESAARINFPQSGLSALRSSLLSDLDREQFCILLGKREEFDGGFVINVIEMLIPGPEAYASHSLGHVTPEKKFILYALSELQERYDVDTLIDVHTHPFSHHEVAFSGIDDDDEIRFSKFLFTEFDGVGYASIVLSREQYDARSWKLHRKKPTASSVPIKAQTPIESIPRTRKSTSFGLTGVSGDEFLDRTVRALGYDTLKSIIGANRIIIIGVGGLGSVIAENLVHMGFRNLTLIDHDVVEVSNLNRIVGAYRQDADDGLTKVAVVARHLRSINPDVDIICHAKRIEDVSLDSDIALSDWIIAATDNHYSRFYAQSLAFKFFVPLISVGVSIVVHEGIITDYSGEVIVVRAGDRLCLSCLERLNPTRIAAERGEVDATKLGPSSVSDIAPDIDRLRQYVQGALVREPAVKTLNSVLGALAVEQLINQYTGRLPHKPVLVYEANRRAVIYPDDESVAYRDKDCFVCGIVV
jgi:molybdopterin-synthase adenylyltransferase